MALQKTFTGIDNEIPERIAAYKAQEQQVWVLILMCLCMFNGRIAGESGPEPPRGAAAGCQGKDSEA